MLPAILLLAIPSLIALWLPLSSDSDSVGASCRPDTFRFSLKCGGSAGLPPSDCQGGACLICPQHIAKVSGGSAPSILLGCVVNVSPHIVEVCGRFTRRSLTRCVVDLAPAYMVDSALAYCQGVSSICHQHIVKVCGRFALSMLCCQGAWSFASSILPRCPARCRAVPAMLSEPPEKVKQIGMIQKHRKILRLPCIYLYIYV